MRPLVPPKMRALAKSVDFPPLRQCFARFCPVKSNKTLESVRKDPQKAQNLAAGCGEPTSTKIDDFAMPAPFPEAISKAVSISWISIFRGRRMGGTPKFKPKLRIYPGGPTKSLEFDNCHEDCGPDTQNSCIFRCFLSGMSKEMPIFRPVEARRCFKFAENV